MVGLAVVGLATVHDVMVLGSTCFQKLKKCAPHHITKPGKSHPRQAGQCQVDREISCTVATGMVATICYVLH